MSKLTMDAWRLTALLSLLSFSVRNFPEAAAQILVVLVAHLCVTVTPWTVARQAPLSMGILQVRILEWVAMPFPQGILPTQGCNPHLPHHRQILYHLSPKGSPTTLEGIVYPFSRGTSQPRNRTGVFCIAGRFFTR